MEPVWTTACPDWADRIREGRSIIPPPIFPDEAEAGLEVLRELRIVDAPGSPRIADASGQWVFDLAASIFGAYDVDSGRRLIKEWFVMLPKKNFKSGLAASIMLTTLIRNWRQSAEFTILAPTLEVAANSFGPAKDMVHYRDDDEDESELSDLIQVQTHVRTLTHREKNATLKVIAADANTAAGKKSVGVLVEELWLFGKQAKAKDMLREATGGLASRPEGFVIYITTQSDEPPEGVFKEKLQYARDVRDGKIIDPQFVPILFEHPPELVATKEHMKLENLPMVNPNLGYSVDREYLEREYRKAESEGEASLKGFLAKYGNVEVGMNLRSDRWTGADFWQQNGDKRVTLDYILRESEVVTIGIDGGGLDDLLGFAVEGRRKESEHCLLANKAWIHPIGIERRKSEESKYRDFERAGDLVVVERPRQDVEEVAALCKQVYDAGLLAQIGLDPERTHKVMFKALVDVGIPEDLIIGITQGWKLTGAMAVAERALQAGELTHSGSEMMAWCVGNAKVVPSGNAVLITKQASGTAKIDPVMASLNAISIMATNPEAKRKSVYETRGIRFL
ncbi:terminase large subunit [Diaphorobacter sp. HDW4B]|uniref:terminase large subunit n=1 Tax=Diaphorobacter sp. HDW4B TaxID=2714925 RepID=UPI00140C4F29|nr:terminase TerL endonuclease subunit [Diaphorobacter sp. HDW4B]QIL69573.1 terminase large subunit [Diaphorobacter sp. HDW4B]